MTNAGKTEHFLRISKVGAKADRKGPLARGCVLCFPHFAIALAHPYDRFWVISDQPIKNV